MQSLNDLLDLAAQRGYAFFNVPDLFLQATKAALDANQACLDRLADDATWPTTSDDNHGSKELHQRSLLPGWLAHQWTRSAIGRGSSRRS